MKIDPTRIRIGQPITVRLSGLEQFIGGYTVRLSNGPNLAFDGRSSFASNGSGEFTGDTVIPVDYHRDFAARRDYPATLQVYQGRDRLSGVVGNRNAAARRLRAAHVRPRRFPLPPRLPPTGLSVSP